MADNIPAEAYRIVIQRLMSRGDQPVYMRLGPNSENEVALPAYWIRECAEARLADSTFTVKITTRANIRREPRVAGGNILRVVNAGVLLRAEGLENGWYKLALGEGYVSDTVAERVV